MNEPENKPKTFSLKPSEVYFCQDTVTQYFNRKSANPFKPIGETLDALCNGSLDISSIPNINVVAKDGKWFTENNRRLWMYKKLELIGKVKTIDVVEVPEINEDKWTTVNGGVSVQMIGIPGGIWWRKIARQFPDAVIESELLPPDFSVMPEDYDSIPESLKTLQSLGTDISYVDKIIDGSESQGIENINGIVKSTVKHNEPT